MEKEEKKTHKQVVTKIGDVFCVEFGNGFKGYFQYIAIDREQLNSSVIRVFKKHYLFDSEPIIEDIVSDDVSFYAHTVLSAGIRQGEWYKIGNSINTGKEKDLNRILFLSKTESPNSVSFWKNKNKFKRIDNWVIRKFNSVGFAVFYIPPIFQRRMELDGVFPYTLICFRMKNGYYNDTCREYNVIKRHPYPFVDTYTKRELNKCVSYYHFHGEHVVEQMDIDGESVVRLTDVQPVCDGHFLYDQPFGSINWHYDDFITAEDFYAVWNSLNPVEISRQHAERLSD